MLRKTVQRLLEPTTDTVTYSDGMTEEVYGFDIPVPAIDEEFDRCPDRNKKINGMTIK